LTSLFADAAELQPKAERTAALEVKYTAGNVIEAYKAFELLTLAAAGAQSLLANVA
jgi:D-aminopeptidase